LRIILFAAALGLLACSVPGMDEANQRIDQVSSRVDDIEEVTGEALDATSEDVTVRLDELERKVQHLEEQMVMTTPATSGSGEAAEVGGATGPQPVRFPALDSLETVSAAQAESLVVMRERIDELMADLDSVTSSSTELSAVADSLGDRVESLEGQVWNLRHTTSGTSRSGSGGSTGGRGSSSGSSSGSSGSSGGSGSGRG